MDYKNVEFLIKAMADLPGYNLQLLSKISDERRSELSALVAPVGGYVTFVNGVTDKAYDEHLLNAVALVHASKDEGFGIPLVEAMGRGIPVVCSNIDIFKEIGGEAASYFESDSQDSFVAAVRALEDQDAWMHHSKNSVTQASKFSWIESAKKLHAMLEII